MMTGCGLEQLEPRPSGFCAGARAELPTDVWLFDHFPSHESRPIVDSLFTTYTSFALSLFSLPIAHPPSVRLIARDPVSCQLRGLEGLQLHPLNLYRLRPSGLAPPPHQQNGLESDS